MTNTTSTPASLLDAETIEQWQREHERVIADSHPGSYSEHVSRQMLAVIALARAGLAATVVREAAAEYREACRNYEHVMAARTTTISSLEMDAVTREWVRTQNALHAAALRDTEANDD